MRERRKEWLNEMVGESLGPVALTAALVKAVLTIMHAVMLGPEAVVPTTAAAGGACVFNAILWLVIRRRPVPPAWAHALGAVIAGSLLISQAVYFAWVPDPRETTSLMLLAIAAGGLVASRRWLAANLAGGLAVFASAALRAPSDPQWLHFGFAFAFSAVLAVLFHEVRLRTLHRLHASLEALELELSERARAEEALRQGEARLRRIYDFAPVMMHSIDAEGRLVAVNEKWLAETGYAREEVIGRSITSVLTPESAEIVVREGMPRLWRTGAIRDIELRMLRRDGSVIEVALDEVALDAIAGSRVSLSVLRNVTGSNRAQSDRERLRHQLFEARKLESLGLLAGGIAHDFNNLLAAILGNAHLVLDALPPDHAQHAAVAEVKAAAERGRLLTRQLLSYAGRTPVERIPLDLSAQVGEVTALLRRSLRPSVSLCFDLADSLPAVEVDPGQLQQVIMNLVRNAADALGSESGTITLRTGLARLERAELAALVAGAGLEPGVYVRLEISDDGCGMDAETRERLFDPFFTRKESGHGLGLPVALGVVRAHGGGIALESEPGAGTCFRVYLPASTREPVAEVPMPETPDVGPHGHVLLADDDAAVRRVARRMLERLGYTVTEAADGHAAIEHAREAAVPFQAALIDLRMPGGGIETARALRELDANLPIVFQSGFDADGAIERAGLGGGLAFLPKPYLPRELGDALRAALHEAERKAEPS